MCVAMCSLAMSLFSHDCIKSISNVSTYLNVYSIHSAPGFQMVKHQLVQNNKKYPSYDALNGNKYKKIAMFNRSIF